MLANNAEQNLGSEKSISTDVITVIMISVCVFVLKSITHEIIGHGGATLLVGEKITFISTMWLAHTDIPTIWGSRFVLAAGPIANLLLAITSILFLRNDKLKSPNLMLFFWLTLAVNLFHFGSYMAGWFIAPSFDWIKIIAGLTPQWLWKTALSVTGCLFVLTGFHYLTKFWAPLIGSEPGLRKQRITKITVIPFITFTIVSLSGIALFETDQKVMMIMGAFGNTAFFLVWMLLLRFWKFNKSDEPNTVALPVERNYRWILGGIILLCFYILIMGPGIQLLGL